MSESASPQEPPAKDEVNDTAMSQQGPGQAVMKKVPTQMVGEFGIELRNLADLWRFAQIYAASGLAPKGMERTEAIAIAVQLGLEVGLHPAQAVQSIAVINGRPSIWGDPQLGLVRRSGLLEEFEEFYEHQGKRVERWPAKPDDTTTAVCVVKRVGYPRAVQSFSVADAKTAKLWGKTGAQGQDTPWVTYPGRMLKMRPRGWNLRDNFGDVLKGLRQAEEVSDYIEVEQVQEPIAMPQAGPAPRDMSEGTGAAVDEALQTDGSGIIHAEGTVIPPAVPENAPPAVKIVTAKRVRTGVREDQTPFTRWSVSTSDGASYDTEDQAVYAQLAKAHIEGKPVRIVAEVAEKGNLRVIEVVPA